MKRILLIAGFMLSTISGAHALPADEALIKAPEMVTHVRDLVDGLTGKIRQQLPDAHSQWEKHSQAGEQAYKSGNYGEAERQLNLALKLAESANPKDKRLALSCLNLAVLYNGRGQVAKAEPLFERYVRELGKLQGAESPEVLMSLARLGQFYVLQDKTAKADTLYAKFLPLVDKKLKLDDRVKDGLKQLERFYAADNQFAQALDAVKKTEEASNRVMAGQHMELAMSLDNFAAAWKLRKKYQPAEQLFKRALDIREKSLAPEHMALAVSMGNLAGLHSAQGKYNEAAPLYKKALEILDRRNVCDATAMAGLASCYEGQEQFDQAERIYLKAIATLEKTSSPGNPEIARSLNKLAAIYTKQGKYAQAEPLLKRSLSITEGMNGPQHSALVPLLENYADVLRKNNKSSQADQSVARARAIRGM